MPITQGYLLAEEDSEVRIRQLGKKHFLTSKNGNGLQRVLDALLDDAFQRPSAIGRVITVGRQLVLGDFGGARFGGDLGQAFFQEGGGGGGPPSRPSAPRPPGCSRPWTLYPPMRSTDCGVRPTCPMTGISAARSARM